MYTLCVEYGIIGFIPIRTNGNTSELYLLVVIPNHGEVLIYNSLAWQWQFSSGIGWKPRNNKKKTLIVESTLSHFCGSQMVP